MEIILKITGGLLIQYHFDDRNLIHSFASAMSQILCSNVSSKSFTVTSLKICQVRWHGVNSTAGLVNARAPSGSAANEELRWQRSETLKQLHEPLGQTPA
jgi:hypothetical protein